MPEREAHQSEEDALVEDLNRIFDYQNRERTKKQKARYQTIILLALGYTLMTAIVSTFYSLKSGQSFFFDSSRSRQDDLYLLGQDVGNLKTSIEQINDALKNTTTSTQYAILDERLTGLQEKQNAIEETILVDPDKAITARLLREKQLALDEKMTALGAQYVRLDDKLNYYINSAIILPIIAFLGWLAKEFLEKKFRKKEVQ